MRQFVLVLTLLVSFLISTHGFAEWKKGWDAQQKKDYANALREWKPLAEQGNAYAQNNLGAMYRDGEGVLQDYKIAVKWFKHSAVKGNTLAWFNLGAVYANGQGVLKDNIYSHMWFNIAASSGDETARRNRDSIAYQMTPVQIEEAQKLARECVRKKYKEC